MDPLATLSNKDNILQLSIALQKIAKAIENQKDNSKGPISTTNELDLLKKHCLSNNVHISQLSCQTLFKLAQNGTLEPATVLTLFITMSCNVKYVKLNWLFHRKKVTKIIPVPDLHNRQT